ncbi:mitochondrial carrier domain-containing protein [Whalleya microplaca]|nr:mitochondrial carrier domain-containing protein [Whalleya microplaca]
MPSSSTLLDTTNSDNFLPALHHAFSGSAGTLISKCTLLPLSLLTTRLQARQLRNDGRAGRASTAHTSTEATDPQTPSQDPDHQHEQNNESSSPGQSPSQRHNHHRQPGVVDSFLQTLRSDGSGAPRALSTGLAQDAAKSVLDSFLFFLFYEWIHSIRVSRSRRLSGREMGIIEELAIGMAAGACSQVFTTPIANIVNRKQTATLVDPDGNPLGVSFRGIASEILQEQGISGFWSGYSASLVLALNPSITFFLQGFLKKRALAGKDLAEPPSHVAFLIAAVSKTIATGLTYPFQTARARLQAGVPVELDTGEVLRGAELGGESPPPEHRDVDQEVEAKLKAIRAVQKFTKQSIFGTIVQIIRLEGIRSLYHGLRGELLRAFFGHGTTMVAKRVVHKLLFKLYLFSLGVMVELRARRARRAMPAGMAVPKGMPVHVPEAGLDAGLDRGLPETVNTMRPDRMLEGDPSAFVRPEDRMLEAGPARSLTDITAARPEVNLAGMSERPLEAVPVKQPEGMSVGMPERMPMGMPMSMGGRPEGGRARESFRESIGEVVQSLPRALQTRLDRSQIVAKPRGRKAIELGLTNVVANLIDGSHRGLDRD